MRRCPQYDLDNMQYREELLRGLELFRGDVRDKFA